MEKTIFHIDVNSAYLSWEAVDRLSKGENLDLRTVPSVVSGDPKQRSGIILAGSYEAKKLGIKTGDTIFSAIAKYKNLVVVAPNYEMYSKASNSMVELLSEYTDEIERYSIDEVFVNVTNAYTNHKNPIDLANEIRNRIEKELGYTVCVGVSNNKLLAKMATDLRKPNFTNTLYPEEIEKKIWHLPVNKLFMVGSKTAPKLNQIGILTIGDLARADKLHIKALLKSHGEMIWEYANGIDSSVVSNAINQAKGVGNSTTTAYDIDDIEEAKMILLSLCECVGMRLRKNNYTGDVISVSLRFYDLTKASKQRKLSNPTNSTSNMYEQAQRLLEEIWNTNKPIRHLGISVSNVTSADAIQLNMFSVKNKVENNAVDSVIDNIREKYGNNSVQRACFIGSNHNHIKGGVEGKDFEGMNTRL